jgi:hypothetical protein
MGYIVKTDMGASKKGGLRPGIITDWIFFGLTMLVHILIWKIYPLVMTNIAIENGHL